MRKRCTTNSDTGKRAIRMIRDLTQWAIEAHLDAAFYGSSKRVLT